MWCAGAGKRVCGGCVGPAEDKYNGCPGYHKHHRLDMSCAAIEIGCAAMYCYLLKCAIMFCHHLPCAVMCCNVLSSTGPAENKYENKRLPWISPTFRGLNCQGAHIKCSNYSELRWKICILCSIEMFIHISFFIHSFTKGVGIAMHTLGPSISRECRFEHVRTSRKTK